MARPRPRRKESAADRRPKKKVSILDTEQITWVDYKDVNLLRRFMSERAKIRARRVTGNDAQQQRAVARAIRVAREMALLPYSVRQVTHRNKGKGRDRDRGDRGVLAESSVRAPEGAPPPDSVDVAPDDAMEAVEELGAVESNGGAPVETPADAPAVDAPAADPAAEAVEETAS
jgi:small subunit ribosomal protein S18